MVLSAYINIGINIPCGEQKYHYDLLLLHHRGYVYHCRESVRESVRESGHDVHPRRKQDYDNDT